MSMEREPTGPAAGGQFGQDPRSDGELAQLVASGDQQAAAVLITRYERLVRSFLRKITGRPELADDLAQDTFVRLLKTAHRYDPKYPMRTWLLTIARRLSINHSRRGDQKVMSTEYEGHHAGADGPDARAEASDTQNATRRMLNEALSQLSEPQRTAIVLFHEKEMSIEDVAAAMEMPVGTIKSHLHRARAAMRKLLGPKVEVVQ